MYVYLVEEEYRDAPDNGGEVTRNLHVYSNLKSARAYLKDKVDGIKESIAEDKEDEEEYGEDVSGGWSHGIIEEDSPDEFYIWIEDDGYYHGYDDDTYEHYSIAIKKVKVKD